MKISAFKFGVSCGLGIGIVWVICSFFVWLMPTAMLSASGHMLHVELSDMGWHLSFSGVVMGLLGWVIAATLSGWLVGGIYNRLH